MVGTIVVPKSEGIQLDDVALCHWVEFDEPFRFPGYPGPLTMTAVADSALTRVNPASTDPDAPPESN
jgi:hypothetical protein